MVRIGVRYRLIFMGFLCSVYSSLSWVFLWWGNIGKSIVCYLTYRVESIQRFMRQDDKYATNIFRRLGISFAMFRTSFSRSSCTCWLLLNKRKYPSICFLRNVLSISFWGKSCLSRFLQCWYKQTWGLSWQVCRYHLVFRFSEYSSVWDSWVLSILI